MLLLEWKQWWAQNFGILKGKDSASANFVVSSLKGTDPKLLIFLILTL